MLIFPPRIDEYGNAEFKDGQEDTDTSNNSANAENSVTLSTDISEKDTYSLLNVGIILFAVIGSAALYLRYRKRGKITTAKGYL